MENRTLVIINPQAGSGRAVDLHKTLPAGVQRAFGGAVQAEVTQRAEDVLPLVQQAHADGVQRVLGVGGDGTNHSLVNAIMQAHDAQPDRPPLAFGCVPVGTGRDWARGLGMPLDDPEATVRWLSKRTAKPTDVVQLSLDDALPRHLLNIASTGLGGEVDRRVNAQPVRRPWTFTQATVSAILSYTPQLTRVMVDGDLWYEGGSYVIVVANGNTFGHGMRIAPRAAVEDGLLDVVVVQAVSRWALLMALRRVYSGTHLTHPAVRHTQAARVEVVSPNGTLPLDIEGEHAQAQRLTFRVRPGALPVIR